MKHLLKQNIPINVKVVGSGGRLHPKFWGGFGEFRRMISELMNKVKCSFDAETLVKSTNQDPAGQGNSSRPLMNISFMKSSR
jgi:hypothetical protein